MIQYTGKELRKFVAPECVFGVDARKMGAKFASNIGARKVLIVTDHTVANEWWSADIITELKKARIPYTIFQNVTPNPSAEEVMSGAEIYLSEKCNCIIALGGGSPIDCAKGIGIVSTNKRNILDFEGVDEVSDPIPPLICIPTTCGSSADVSQFAIITDSKRKLKVAIISKAIVPDVSLIDPITFITMPADVAADTGTDSLTHAFEAYVSNAHSDITDMFALEAVRIISSCLADSIKDPLNIGLKEKMSMACLYAGLAFSNAGLGLVHAMSHSLGGKFGSQHGQTNAVLLSNVISFNFQTEEERYKKLGEAMGLNLKNMHSADLETAIINRIKKFLSSINMPVSLSELGIEKSNVHELAEKAINDPDIATNPREPNLADIEEIYGRLL